MAPEFDDIAKQAFSTVANLMGEDAVWLSSKGAKIDGKILFKDPSEAAQIGDSEGYEYRPNTATAEYYEGTFAGLKEASDRQEEEYLQVRSSMYAVVAITTKFDGNTYVAHLEPHED